MSLELSNEDLRKLIDLAAGAQLVRHPDAPDTLSGLRQRLAAELARREPGATVLEHTERVRELVMRWREVAPLVEGMPPDQELAADVLKLVFALAREVYQLNDPVLGDEYGAWAQAHNLPSGSKKWPGGMPE